MTRYSQWVVPSSLASTAIKTANYSANAGERILCNTSAGSFTITLPITPGEGDRIGIVDISGSFNAKNLTISGNGNNIAGSVTNFVCDINYTFLTLVYNSTVGWIVEQTPSAASGSMFASFTPGGRLTLASGDPFYDPQNTIAVSGQDTTNDTITVTAHGWLVGTMVTSSATSGGLVADAVYYVGNITTNIISLYTTLSAAISGGTKVDITGAVTANITAFGVANQTIYYTPTIHNQIALWNGSVWAAYNFNELSIALGTLTSSIGYDVFVYNNLGTPALELLAWSSATARATAITYQDGRRCKSGDKTRLYIGSFYTRDTTSTESSVNGVVSQLSPKRYLYNYYNRADISMKTIDKTASWSYTIGTWRYANNNSGNRFEVFFGFQDVIITGQVKQTVNISGASARSASSGIGLDASNINYGVNAIGFSAGVVNHTLVTPINIPSLLGYHYGAWIEYGGDGTNTWYGQDALQTNGVYAIVTM